MSVEKRRAMEALRAGVPNRDAVSFLGTDQVTIEQRFRRDIANLEGSRLERRQLPGFVIGGDFGAGKSHLLGWLQHLALDNGFAVSKVVISKETPLGDLPRVFRAAMESLRLPDRAGGLDEAVHAWRPNTEPYDEMMRRILAPGSGFEPQLQATLHVHERIRSDPELMRNLETFWQGGRMSLSELKAALRSIGALGQFPDLRSRAVRDLAIPRFRFAAELLAGAGYRGWVLLLDEIELLASYALQSRARGYAALAALSGNLVEQQVPGVITVAASTTDLTRIVFDERRDHEVVPQKVGVKHPKLVPEAEAGMRMLMPHTGDWLTIQPQTATSLEVAYRKTRELYTEAYGWEPPPNGVELGESSRRMRQYVRHWIARWDLQRLYPGYDPQIESEEVVQILSEDPDLERASASTSATESEEDSEGR